MVFDTHGFFELAKHEHSQMYDLRQKVVLHNMWYFLRAYKCSHISAEMVSQQRFLLL